MIFSAELILGALAGALGQVFTIPVSVVATRQQLDDKSQSLLATTLEIVREDGITGLWNGLKASLVLTVVCVQMEETVTITIAGWLTFIRHN